MADVNAGIAAPASRDSKRRSALLKLGALAGILAAAAVLATFTPVGALLSREGVLSAVGWLRQSPWAPVVFVAAYAGATALALPGSVLTLAGGAVFGLWWGTLYNTLGANLGANLAFWIARSLGRDGVRALAGNRLDALDRATASYGFQGLLTLRLIPVVPFNALNFGAGLTGISWPAYAAATLIGILPGTFVYTMFADALLAGSTEASRQAFIRVLISGGLLVALSFLPTLARKLGIRLPGGSGGPGDAPRPGSSGGPGNGPRPGSSGGPGGTSRPGPGPLFVLTPLLPLVLGASAAGAPLRAQALPDPATFTAVLSEVVTPEGVRYTLLKRRRAGLDRYLELLARTPAGAVEKASKNERLAFWINAYNACMLRLVVDHYPIRRNRGLLSRLKNTVADRPANSVWQIEDVFTRPHCSVAGALRSQDEIEHQIIRPMGDPRIHFAVNCAARSCPPLWPEAYAGPRLDAQLDRAVRALVRDPRHFRGDPARKVVRLNKVMDWFKEDFGGEEGLRTFLAPYAPPPAAALLRDPATRIEFFDYDWTLNDVDAQPGS